MQETIFSISWNLFFQPQSTNLTTPLPLSHRGRRSLPLWTNVTHNMYIDLPISSSPANTDWPNGLECHLPTWISTEIPDKLWIQGFGDSNRCLWTWLWPNESCLTRTRSSHTLSWWIGISKRSGMGETGRVLLPCFPYLCSLHPQVRVRNSEVWSSGVVQNSKISLWQL